MSAARTPLDVAVGDELPRFDLDVTATVIVAGAIASRDFMPVHHDAEYARRQGAPHLFMNILVQGCSRGVASSRRSATWAAIAWRRSV